MSQNTKAAWGRILDRYIQALAEYEKKPEDVGAGDIFDFFFSPTPSVESKSIFDEIQAEYRANRITESERNAMRAHVKVWLGDPDQNKGAHYGGPWGDRNLEGYDTYSCGLWAPTAAPWGAIEHAIIVNTVTILMEEDAG